MSAIAAAPRPVRTLIATLDPPWPMVSGAELRNAQNVVAAAGIGPTAIVSVTAAPAGSVPADFADVYYAMTQTPAGTLHACRPTPAEADRILPPDAAEGLSRVIQATAPDTLVIEHPALLALGVEQRRRGLRLVMDMHNVESVLAARAARAHFPFALKAWRAELAAARASVAFERRALTEADAVWVCSPEDAARLPRIDGGAAVHVVPNGIPRIEQAPGALRPNTRREKGAMTLIFIGHLGYPPNVAAARWLAREILPAARRRADLRLVLAGRNPAPSVHGLAQLAAVAVIANPASTDELLAGADIAVLPLRDGGGTRIKAIEAMSRGLPIVATRFAVEGLGLADGVHFAAAETTRDFARAIASLSAETDARANLAAAAFRHCVANFGPGAIARAIRTGLAAP